MNEGDLIKMAKEILENGDFDVSGYARIEKVGLEWLAEQSETPATEEDIARWVKNTNDYDGLSDWAYETAITMPLLENGEIFVLNLLDKADREQRLAYQAELNKEEQARFRQLYCELSGELPEWAI